MAITYWPKHGENNTERSFAGYVDKLFGYADHASSDTACQLRFTSTDGTNDTWTLSAGSYVFDGYVFTAAGTETVTTVKTTATDVHLYYTLDANSHITAAGIAKAADVPGGTTYSLKLWTVQNGAVTDYRQVFTWGRQSVASTSGSAISFLSEKETQYGQGKTTYDATYVWKRFRTGYPGTVRLDIDVFTSSDGYGAAVYRVRGGVATLLTTLQPSSSNAYQAMNYTVTGLQAGDYIDIQGNTNGVYFKFKNFRIRYITQDTPPAAVLVD